MRTSATRKELFFGWIVWVLGTAVGWFISQSIIVFPFDFIQRYDLPTLARNMTAMLLAGIIVGATQWLVLRQFIGNIKHWIPITILGYGLIGVISTLSAILGAEAHARAYPQDDPWMDQLVQGIAASIFGLLGYAIGGILHGIAQAILLEKVWNKLRLSIILMTAISWFIPGIDFVMRLAGNTFIFLLIIAGLLQGGISGIAIFLPMRSRYNIE